jgi:[acyl-carrier-protein] S-malonyltransferase
MGRALYERSAGARRVIDAADSALGEPFSRLMFEGPEDRLLLTANAQPAILTLSIATLEALRELCPSLSDPGVAAGHSLGEYSALVAAGSLQLEDAVRLVRLRGEAMQRAVAPGEGTMAAFIGGTPERVQAACSTAERELEGQVVVPANFNAPGQIVVAGHVKAVQRASELATADGLRVIALKVSAPFHCSLMTSAAQALARALGETRVTPPRFTVLRNVDAAPHAANPTLIVDALVKQVCSAVQWQASMDWMTTNGATQAFEFGPGKVLAGLLRKGAPNVGVITLSEPDDLESAARALVAA